MDAAAALRILIIEDDPRMADVLRRGLWERGHTIMAAATAAEGEQLAETHEFDAIVLDVGLPDRSGFSVAERLRGRPDRPAIVMLTSQREEDHIVAGLDSGADDYVTKPFSFSELIARIGSASRRSRFSKTGEIRFGGFLLDLQQHRLLHGSHEVHLTRSEFLLLRELALRCGEPVLRRQLIAAVWGTTQVTQGALDTLIGTLRDRLDAAGDSPIATLRGQGYMLQRGAAKAETVPS